MTWSQLATFNVVLIVAIASPGPAMLMATQTSLSAGRTAGIAVGAGLGLMAAIWTMMALLDFGVVFVLFAAAVLVTVFPAGIGLADSIVIVANHFLVEIAFYTALAFGMSTQAVAKRYMQAKIHIDRAAAAVLGALGVRILLSR